MRRAGLPCKTVVVIAALAAFALMPAALATARTPGTPVGAKTVAARTVADVTPATAGLCSVPGIGDIGGLLGLCALGTSGLTGELNSICQPALPSPEPANTGIDAMVSPPGNEQRPATLYDEYGVAGDYWAATNLQCSDMTSLVGNDVAGMVFDAAKAIDRVTITVYVSAAGEGILSWLQRVTDRLIASLGNAIYYPYLAVVVILAAIWLAWHGLIRRRATQVIEGTVWLVVACAAAVFLIGKPAAVTGVGRDLSDGVSQALNVAFAKLPSPGPSSCVPVQKGDPQAQAASYGYTSQNAVVDQNADELWTVLVCKPWLVGEFGTSVYSTSAGQSNAVARYGRSLLWAQAIAVNEKPTPALIQAKQATFAGIASNLQANDPALYPLFQGKQWTTRLEVAFAALFAAVVAGVLVLVISVTLIVLKLGFLLLLIVGPFFLLVGAHPGFGRVVAVRWAEMLAAVLLKQAAVALVLSVLLYCYALIMGTADAVLPWALKILMIALVTAAAFIYRKPFQHLFSAVGHGVLGSQSRAEADLRRAGATARDRTMAAAKLAVPPFAAYRAGRWAQRNPGQAASAAAGATTGGASAVAAGLLAGGAGSVAADGRAAADRTAAAAGDEVGGEARSSGRRTQVAEAATLTSRLVGPPPLDLPSRDAPSSRALAGSPASGNRNRNGVTVPALGAWPGANHSNGHAGGPLTRQKSAAPPLLIPLRPMAPFRPAASASSRAPASRLRSTRQKWPADGL